MALPSVTDGFEVVKRYHPEMVTCLPVELRDALRKMGAAANAAPESRRLASIKSPNKSGGSGCLRGRRDADEKNAVQR